MMKVFHRRQWIAAGLILLALVAVVGLACGDSMPTPAPTATPIPTPTPSPTPTATPLPTPAPSLFPLTITDSNGDSVTLDEPPERIVAIDAAAVEILFAMGEGHRVVGTHDFVDYPPETEDVEKVGSAFALNYERIAALEPDLITIFFTSPLPELQRLNVTVLYLDTPSTLEAIPERMRLWGRIVGNPPAGEEVARAFEQTLVDVTAKAAGTGQGPSVFFLGDPTFWTVGQGTLAQSILEFLGAKNIFSDVDGFVQVSPEQVVARQPEVLLAVYTVGPDPSHVIEDNPSLKDLPAVRGGRVYRADATLLAVAGPRLAQGIEQVAGFLYPELFD